jgi:hypothetical protein
MNAPTYDTDELGVAARLQAAGMFPIEIVVSPTKPRWAEFRFERTARLASFGKFALRFPF